MVETFLASVDHLLELRRSIDAPLFSEGDKVYVVHSDTKYYYVFKDLEEKHSFLSKYNNYLNTPITRIPLRICTNEISDSRFIFHVPPIQYIKQYFSEVELSIFDCDIKELKDIIMIKVVKYSGGRLVDAIDISTLYYDNCTVDRISNQYMSTMVSTLHYAIDLVLEPYINSSWIDIDCLNLSKYTFSLCLVGKGVTTF